MSKNIIAIHKQVAKKLEFKKIENSPEEFEKLTVGALRRAVVDGDVESGSFLCGAIAGMVNEVKPCDAIVKEIMEQAEKLLKI